AAEVDLTEIYPVLTEIKHAIAHLKSWARPKRVEAPLALLGTSSYIKFEPKGVCLIISPWNFPFNLTIGPLVSAIAAGNTAMIKPSEMTPHTSAMMERLVKDLFEENLVAMFQGGIPITQALLDLPFDHIFFTGSPSVGKIVMKAAAAHLTSVTLELGGKSPVIVDGDVDIKDAAEKISWGKFINNGQTCVAPDYLLVHESIAKDFTSALIKSTEKQFRGRAKSIEESSDYARLVNDKHFIRLVEMLDISVSSGTKVEFGGESNGTTRYLAPTIVSQVPLNSPLMSEEIFGPILPILTYKNLEDAISQINKFPKPLALYYFGRSKKNQKSVLHQTSSGGVCINECVLHFNHANLPFGGVNNSGIGKSHGRHGFEAFSNEKAVLKQRVGLTSSKFIYPPYTPSVKRIIDLMVRYF
ncbi:MAG: aldehyde dehydrogenase family protein, partial [Chloroflexota bacterium]